jgi:hypothetical protein
MSNVDFFNFFRYALGTVVTIYAALITIHWAAGWYKLLMREDRHTSLMRHYLIVSGLRIRLATFWADVLISLLLCVAFLLLWRAHWLIGDIGATLSDVHRKLQPLQWRGG